MRMARLAIAVAILLGLTPLANAEALKVRDIETQIEKIQKEYQSVEQKDEQLRKEERRLREAIQTLRENSEVLEQERRDALENMNERYQLVVTNPATDISQAVQAYQSAVDKHQANLNEIREQVTLLGQKQEGIQQSGLTRHALVNRLASYQEKLESARIVRVREEFNRRGSIKATDTVSCAKTETFQACEERGKQLVRQRASKKYAEQLFDRLTEAKLAENNRTASGASVRILGARVLDSGFSGQGEYSVQLEVDLEGQLLGNQACTLLGIDSRYCSSHDKTAGNEETSSKKKLSQDGVMHQVTLRSNVYDDEVFIDGVSYGSTPLKLMLSTGEYDFVVSKHGYDGESKRVDIHQATTVRFELNRLASTFVRGERVQDALYEGTKGPGLIIVPAGRAQVGDQTGHGRPEEQPVRSVRIGDMFGVGVYQVTVDQFRDFIAATKYETEAEKAKGCAVLGDNNGTIWDESLDWRNPGFEQKGNSPVVCVSYNDAQAYVAWLTEVTGNVYKLPTEAQWEYVARAGTESDYWFGNSVGVGRANCFSCSADWQTKQTTVVGSFPANPWGVYDTVGNVWEWTVDERSGLPVLKGGAFNFAASLARAAARLEMPASFRSNYAGMRVIRTQ